MNTNDPIQDAQQLLKTIDKFANIGLDLAKRIADVEGRQVLVRELGLAAVKVLFAEQAPSAAHGRADSSTLEAAVEREGDVETGLDIEEGAKAEHAVGILAEFQHESDSRAEFFDAQQPDDTRAPLEDHPSMVTTVLSAMPSVIGLHPGVMAVQALAGSIVQMAETAEIETTKRAQIMRQRDETIARIQAVQQTMELYLNRTFDERKENFSRLFDVLDRAQEGNDLQGMQLALSGILELVKTSPFKDFASFKERWENPETVWEL